MSSNANYPNAPEGSLIEAVAYFIRHCVDHKKWTISQSDNPQEFTVEFAAGESAWGTAILISKEYEQRQLTVATGLLLRIPKEARNAMAELVVRINAVKDGSDPSYFHFDMDEGSLGLISSVNLNHGVLTWSLFEQLIDENRIIAEDFTDAIISVSESAVTPVEAIEAYRDNRQTDIRLH